MQRTNVWTPRGKAAGGVGCGVMNWEIGIDMYTLMCIKWMTNKKINKLILKKEKQTTTTKCFTEKQKLKEFSTTKPAL